MVSMKTTPASRPRGFTLVELLVAGAASLAIISVTLGSVLTFQQMSQRLDDRLTQEVELQRSLHFIAADIQEGKRIKQGAPNLSGYRGLFQVVRPDGSTIGYYITARGDRPWSGPQIVYRRDSREGQAYALVDQISAQPVQNCLGSGTLVTSPVGFSVVIDKQTKATVCIRGHLLESAEGIEASIKAATRVAP